MIYLRRHGGLKDIRLIYGCCLVAALLAGTINHVEAQSPVIIAEEVSFISGGVELRGTIYSPRHPFASVVLVHGSDPQPRMRAFAARLADEGISVLTYDKRGVGESGGIYVGPEAGTNNVDPANLRLLAEDACAAVNLLRTRNPMLSSGLVGISQAGWIIPIAASKSQSVDFMVIFSGSMVSTLEQLRFQFFTEGKADFWDNHTEAQVRQHIACAEDRYRFQDTDPLDSLRDLSIPGLWLFGQKDTAVPAGLSIERLDTLTAEGKPYEYCLFSGLGHNLLSVYTPGPFEIAVHWIKKITTQP